LYIRGEILSSLQRVISLTLAPALRVGTLGLMKPVTIARDHRIDLDPTITPKHFIRKHYMTEIERSMQP
jgi:hypothetical protein